MTIYVDVSSAVHAKAGLSRYAENLVRELKPLLGERLCLFQNSLGRRGPLPGWEGQPARGVALGYKPWRMAVWLRHVFRWPMDHLLPGAELFHATEHLLPPLAHIPTVLTVHDLVFERFPQYHKVWNYTFLKSAMPLFCRRATAIIAISEATKADLQALYSLDPAKITVIPEAAAARFVPQPAERIEAARRRYSLPTRYVLTVGTIEPRKNLDRLVDACEMGWSSWAARGGSMRASLRTWRAYPGETRSSCPDSWPRRICLRYMLGRSSRCNPHCGRDSGYPYWRRWLAGARSVRAVPQASRRWAAMRRAILIPHLPRQ